MQEQTLCLCTKEATTAAEKAVRHGTHLVGEPRNSYPARGAKQRAQA